MSKMTEALDFVMDGIKKYGLMIFILVMMFQFVKKIWHWIVLPVFLLISFKAISNVYSIAIVEKIGYLDICIMWIFVFSVLRLIGKTLFTVK